MNDNIRMHIFIKGRVQGVFFRENTRRQADSLGVSGWVKNLADGWVEITLEGEKEKVEKIIDWFKKGPALAKVENIIAKNEEFSGEFTGFEIKF